MQGLDPLLWFNVLIVHVDKNCTMRLLFAQHTACWQAITVPNLVTAIGERVCVCAEPIKVSLRTCGVCCNTYEHNLTYINATPLHTTVAVHALVTV